MTNKARGLVLALLGAAALSGVPASAQFSPSYNFLKAVRDADGQKTMDALNKPGTGIVNTRDLSTGETALLIVTRRRDQTWMAFMLSRGADPNLRANNGDTPLLVAAQLGFVEGAQLLLGEGARVDQANDRGETALMLAVHNRDLAAVRLLLTAGANPKLQDRATGKSSLDYAAEDPRAAAVAKLLAEAPARAPASGVAGPHP